MRAMGLTAAATIFMLTGVAMAQAPAARTVDPKCPPGGCTIPVPYPVKSRTAAPGGATAPATAEHGIKPHTGSEPGVLTGGPKKPIMPHRAANPNPTPPAPSDDIKPSVGDEAGSPSGRPHKAVGPPIKFDHRGVNPNPTPPRNPTKPLPPQ